MVRKRETEMEEAGGILWACRSGTPVAPRRSSLIDYNAKDGLQEAEKPPVSPSIAINIEPQDPWLLMGYYAQWCHVPWKGDESSRTKSRQQRLPQQWIPMLENLLSPLEETASPKTEATLHMRLAHT